VGPEAGAAGWFDQGDASFVIGFLTPDWATTRTIVALGRGGSRPLRRGDNGSMTTAPVRRDELSSVRTRLLVTGGVLTGGVGLAALFATTDVGLVCPFLALTGWQCPLCGGTRMGSALLHGDLAAAAAANPVALVAVAVLGLLTVLWTVELLGGPAVRLPGRLAAALRRVPGYAWPVLGAVLAAAYAVLRNMF
jgi:hypothetical protein